MKKNKDIELNEIVINGITYIRKDSIKHNYKLYEEIKWKNLDWYVIGLDNEKIRLLLKDVIPRNILEEIIEDKWYLGDDNGVIMSDNVRPPFNFKDTYICNDLLPEFLSYLDIEDREGLANIDLLTKEEVESLPEEVKKCNDWYWTKTNYENDNYNYARMWFVYSTGNLSSNDVTNSGSGLRPAVSLPLEYLDLGI